MEEKILEILAEKCGVEPEDLKEDMDIDLFEEGLLDSFAMLGLLVDFDEQLGVKIEITELERSEINTPNKVIECLSKRG
ncbi:MAG: D-alanine--poly(phosphoribitol) ligase subunit DltC [Oscillospiraceae bacterium]|nr:D-alanine--poly(phosphoribitol) ligase subunit DltC [Oscillospiraceae bacterium]MBQ8868603.1 D-alanine--poly(phosphoribitol) ligase subunit DltC [Oscillospiraceae bacterium]